MTRKIWMPGAIVMAVVSVASGDLFIEPLPPDAPQGFDAFFTKYVDVLGVGVYATSDTQDVKVLRCANVLAQYLDNDEDGKPDNPSVHARMVAGEAGMVMWPTFDDFENSGFFESVPESSIRNKQDCMGEETIPNWQDIQQFDASLEECFHLVNYVGFSGEYPQVFGEDPGSEVADAMNVNIANGYFHYNDPTCDYQCKVIEYTYWAMTSMLGAQEAPWRAAEIANEWELPTRALVEQNDPLIFAILNDPMWGLPTVLPDGNYDGSPGKGSCPGDLNGDGVVDSADLGLLLVAWDTADSAADLDGSGVVGGSDLGLFLLAWGGCPTDPCAGSPCDDGDPCTIDICNPTTGTCTHEQIPGCGGGDDVCGGNNPWPCTEAHEAPGCTNGDCCSAVCEADSFCCQEEWDIWCVAAAYKICGKGEKPDLDCCEVHEFPGCIEGECEDAVCQIDASCCEDSWDIDCVQLAQQHCGCGG